MTELPFSQAGIRVNRLPVVCGDSRSRGEGPGQVTAVDRVDVLFSECISDACRLPMALCIQGDIGAALDTRCHVPIGFTVPNSDDSRDVHV